MARKCPNCRKYDVLDTRWDRFKHRLMYVLFGEQIADVRQGAYTQGHTDGYILGKNTRPHNIHDILQEIERV